MGGGGAAAMKSARMIALREPSRHTFEKMLQRVDVAGQTYCGTRPETMPQFTAGG